MRKSMEVLDNSSPILNDFIELRALAGWENPCADLVKRSLDKSLFWATIYFDKQLVAVGRVVGDGEMYFYIQDVLVHPEHQGKGHGKRIMVSINSYLDSACKPGSTIGLLAAKGKEGFYEKFGYLERDGNVLGLGMCRFV